MGNDRDTGLRPSYKIGEAIEIKVEAYRGVVAVGVVTGQDEQDLQDGCLFNEQYIRF